MRSQSDRIWNQVPRHQSLTSLVLGLSIYLLWPVHAFAQAMVRFVHAVPGAGAASVEVSTGSGTASFGPIAFAQTSAWHSLRSGKFLWRLLGSNGKALAKGSATVGDGAYTAVLLAQTNGVVLGIYRDRRGEPGKSLIRVIHAAPELGSPSLKLDSQVVVQRLDFTKATPYLSVNPGTHSLAAMRTGDSAPIVSVKGVRLVSDVAYTAIVVGSRGQQVRVVTVTDRGAPLTRRGPSAVGSHSHPAAPASAAGWVTIKAGDSLWAVARRQLGSSASNAAVSRELSRIWDANAARIGTGDPNLIFPGQRLHLPR
jgi:hypothetical protein